MTRNRTGTKNRLFERIGVDYPIIQAPMGGGPTTPELVAAVANAGGLGSIAGGYLEPDELLHFIEEVRRRTDRPFAVNLFAGPHTVEATDASAMLSHLARWHDALGLPPPEMPEQRPDRFDEKIEVILTERVGTFSFTFGIPEEATLTELRRHSVVVMGTATTVDEARMLEDAGVDSVVAQGSEAGAHRGTFASDPRGAMIGSMALIPQVADAVRIPVIGSGGIMDGRGIMAALVLGATGVQMGTAFLRARESNLPEAYRSRLMAAREDETVVTRAFSGKPARGIRNAFISDIEGSGAPVPPYPLQNSLTRSLRRAAAAQGNAEGLSLWAGQGVRLSREDSAAELIRRWVEECDSIRLSFS